MSDKDILIVQVSPSLIPVPLVRDAFIVMAAKLLSRRVVVFYRGWKEDIVSMFKKRSFIRKIFQFVYGRADVTMVLASHFKEDLVEFGWCPDSIKVTTTMYVADEILPAKDRSKKRPRFLFLGRLSHLKGIGELIDAAKLLADKNLDFEFLMVGHGDRKGVVEDYKSKIKEYNLGNRFHFTGRLEGKEKYQAFADSDIYVFPSWTEGCPTSVLEALGAGLFIISTDVGALRDIIVAGKNGKIVRCRDHHHLAETMAWACDNIEEIRNCRQKIQEDAKNHYTTEIITEQFATLYQSLVDE
ncbi:glycosyltransferase family 4 protein [Desulfocapsa sulfexigens]|uniref:glycosyltransferase family 4 protein n=1 Tax=Desulfocapsa sulfexigens TaxID=65555 RepID=UPI001427EAAD|nr:glycosyltransferase family 4 protein [Desulfocapsa sulfexigens]